MPSFEELPSGSVRAVVRTPGAGKLQRTFPDWAQAQVWAATQELRKSRGTQITRHATARLTLADYRADWAERRTVEDSTADKQDAIWRTHVEPMWGRARLASLTPAKLDAWVALMRKQGVSPTTIHGAVNTLSVVLKSAVRDGVLDMNPRSGMNPLPPIPQPEWRPLTRAELDRLLDASPEPWRSLWLVTAHTGMRWGEIAGLPVRNVDLDAGLAHIRQTLRADLTIKPYPKSRKPRTVALSHDAATALKPLVDGRPGSDLVFTNSAGGPLAKNNVRKRYWNPAVAKANLPDPQPTFHDLRHTAGTWMAEHIPLTGIRDVLGHADTRITERYIHLAEGTYDAMRAVFNR